MVINLSAISKRTKFNTSETIYLQLGSPPKDYNQNANEECFDQTSQRPRKVITQRNNLVVVRMLLQKEVRGQEENIKLALLGKG